MSNLPPTEAEFIERITEMAHNWRYSDEFIGNIVRSWVGRGRHDGSIAPGRLVFAVCSHCETAVPIKDGLIATHDWPPFTRQVCPGAKRLPTV